MNAEMEVMWLPWWVLPAACLVAAIVGVCIALAISAMLKK
jgi:hypothetical protein